jgi:hypothetical protein
MSKHWPTRLKELRQLDSDLKDRIKSCWENIAALDRLKKKELKDVSSLQTERSVFEVELLDLQAKYDYEMDTKSEQSINNKSNQ